MATINIVLTPRERQLRQLLLDVARYIDDSNDIKEKIELRFAGGWVRDKLLRIQSHDIDVGINAMTGCHFADKMQEYLEDAENLKKYDIDPEETGKIHKVSKNPEKSKHLETATTKRFGFELDFVNLRKETYTADSRNPEMEFGTPLEDALRRDATINALFYNLQTDKVEDFTGGLEDLQNRRIRTPLEPNTTFMDDPLRVLRLIRFASRLDFTIDNDVEAWMSEPAVKEALLLKISRERVGIEIEKMLKGNHPRNSLHFLDRLGLYSTIFTDPTHKDVFQPRTDSWAVVYDCLENLRLHETPGSIYHNLVRSDDAKFIAWILAATVPWAEVSDPRKKSTHKSLLPLGAMAIREGLKVGNKVISVVDSALKNFGEIICYKNEILLGVKPINDANHRAEIGMAIRRWDAREGNWRLQVLFALLVEAMRRGDSEKLESLYIEWQSFIEHLENMDIMDASTVKMPIDGLQLCAHLGGVKPGGWMKAALDVCMEWRLRNPEVKDEDASRAGAAAEVMGRRMELKIPMVEDPTKSIPENDL